MEKPDRLTLQSPSRADENFRRLAELFPGAVTETIGAHGQVVRAIDADVLRQEISVCVVEGPEERYQLTWPDKRQAVLASNAPIRKALRPCRAESAGRDGTPGGFDSENLYIEGDNLDVLKLMRETYLGKIKMIYIDPPYNTGHNLIYRNDYFQNIGEYLPNSGQYDEAGNRLLPNLETNGRFHTDWMNMIYPRLRLAKDLLTADGVLAVAIDENEFASLSMMLKEIFGESAYTHSYVSIVHNPRGQQGNNFSYVNEYMIFVYPSDGQKYLADFPKAETDARTLRDSGTSSDRTDARNCFYPFLVKEGRIVSIGDVPPDSFHPEAANVLRDDGLTEVWPMTDSGSEKKWRYARQSVDSIRDGLEVKKGRSSLQIIYNKQEETMRSVWANAKYDSSEYGTKLLQELLGDSSFTYPKSLWAVRDALMAGVKHCKDAIVLDFFSGSATTAHAVMQLNAEDGGQRRFIMVQIPEPISETSKVFQAGYHDLCEIGKERIRRAGAKLRAENAGQALDTGFRVLKCGSSNMKDVYYTPAATGQEQLNLLADNIKEDRTPEDLLFQVMLELGIPLSSSIEATEIAGKTVFGVDGGRLLACFDSSVDEQTITQAAKRRPDYFVMRDSSLANDTVTANFEQIFAAFSPNTVRKVL